MTHEGAILVIDLSIKEHAEAGILAQHIFIGIALAFAACADEASTVDPLLARDLALASSALEVIVLLDDHLTPLRLSRFRDSGTIRLGAQRSKAFRLGLVVARLG